MSILNTFMPSSFIHSSIQCINMSCRDVYTYLFNRNGIRFVVRLRIRIILNCIFNYTMQFPCYFRSHRSCTKTPK